MDVIVNNRRLSALLILCFALSPLAALAEDSGFFEKGHATGSFFNSKNPPSKQAQTSQKTSKEQPVKKNAKKTNQEATSEADSFAVKKEISSTKTQKTMSTPVPAPKMPVRTQKTSSKGVITKFEGIPSYNEFRALSLEYYGKDGSLLPQNSNSNSPPPRKKAPKRRF